VAYSPDQVRAIIRPAIESIGMWSPSAEDLLLGTAIQESRLTYIRQLGGGPARGLWQMEPFTHDDIWTHFLAFRSALATKVRALGHSADELETNHPYAAAMARLKYYRSPLHMPAHGDINGYAHLWKVVYNTAGGAGTEAEFLENYQKALGSKP
jgi:hypothetical protein